MKKLLSLALACLLLFSLSACGREPKEEVSNEKPVIYLYPEQETDVRVTLDLAGELTCAYPAYGDGWSVRAAPDGTLTDQGRAVLHSVADGVLAPSQGAALLGAIGTLARVTELDELESRIAALEARNGKS